MTKDELLKFLEPFTGDIEIMVLDNRHHYHQISSINYYLKLPDAAIVLIVPNPCRVKEV